MLRCRLRGGWTFLARLGCSILVAAGVIVGGVLGALGSVPFVVLIPAYVVWVQFNIRKLQRLAATFLDDAARSYRLIRVNVAQPAKPASAKA
jgi:hypothetical protein